ncbi:MAG TPA: peptidoglycan DD-metalloendopeptidase family protein [Methylomirabilota bacterium]|jgi:murein DD-endopeptidase MepM/ murein hydrolase activator NlpD|nr:peptidoglycan DD-metalloendopeptidase family protein [Methylomirabilota bacterium]
MTARSVLLAVLTLELAAGGVLLSAGYLSLDPFFPAPPPVHVKAYPAPPRIRIVDLRRGDTLVKALQREGVPTKVGTDIASALADEGVNLRKLTPRHGLAIEWSLDGQPRALRYEPSPWLGYAVMSTEDGWKVRRAETRPDVRVEAVSGEVRRSLFEAVESAGESAELVIDLAEIFSSEFDFTADTRAGDRFRLLVEKRYAADTFVDYGRILVAQYVSDGRTLTGVGVEGARGRYTYYDPAGRSLKKSFLKSPLQFSRITSGFTYARPHPILGGTRPHLAIDYGAPVGTPVWAVADGTVKSAGWNGGNGISVLLKHRSGYATMYNHLSRLGGGMRPGARVSQRQIIGYVGSTGLSTGPHLDYRIARNGQFVNPLSEKFIPGEPIAAADRPAFTARARDLVRRLETAASF